jgi:hypothetical protein
LRGDSLGGAAVVEEQRAAVGNQHPDGAALEQSIEIAGVVAQLGGEGPDLRGLRHRIDLPHRKGRRGGAQQRGEADELHDSPLLGRPAAR